MISRTQYAQNWIDTHEAAIARRRLTSCNAAAMASFDALCSRHKSLARLPKIIRTYHQQQTCIHSLDTQYKYNRQCCALQ
jgi:hypothetical protein